MKKQTLFILALVYGAVHAYTRIDEKWTWIAPSPLIVYTVCALIAAAVFVPNALLVTSLFVMSFFATYVNSIAVLVIFGHFFWTMTMDAFKEWFPALSLFFCNVAIDVLLNDYCNEIRQKSFVSSLAKI